MPRIEQVEVLDPDDGAGLTSTPSSPATTPARRPGSRRPIVVGTPVAKPTPVFTKLDPSVVDEELARLEA